MPKVASVPVMLPTSPTLIGPSVVAPVAPPPSGFFEQARARASAAMAQGVRRMAIPLGRTVGKRPYVTLRESVINRTARP